MKSDILYSIDKAFNEEFADRIIQFFKDEIELRKKALLGSAVDTEDYFVDECMQEIFLKTYAMAYSRMYGFANVSGAVVFDA